MVFGLFAENDAFGGVQCSNNSVRRARTDEHLFSEFDGP